MRLICFPNFEVAILGGPSSVKLTEGEAKAMERVHLGGLEALRTDTYRCGCKTVDSLVRKGLLAGNGPTDLGRRVGRAVAESSLS